MNNITYAVSVDVNNPIIPYNVYVASVLDSNVRYLEITLYQNGNVIALSNEATATASLVTDNVLVDGSVNCTISDNIITVPLEDLQRHGNLDVQVTVTEGEKVLAIPFPIQVKVTPNIAENAQIDENSLGSYAEVVHEITEARGTYTTLHDAITAKLSAAPGAVDTENLADESITVEKVADDLAAVINAKEVKSNKKTTLTGNESSNDFYPTTKAVADALNTKVSRLDIPSTINLLKGNGSGGISVANPGSDYQPPLVSGTNIKTINNISILGSGNINIEGSGGSSDLIVSDLIGDNALEFVDEQGHVVMLVDNTGAIRTKTFNSSSATNTPSQLTDMVYEVHRRTAANTEFPVFSIKGNVLVIGDSTVAGTNVGTKISALMSIASGYTLTDISQGGDTIQGQTGKYNNLSSSVKAAINYAVIQIGLNDVYPASANLNDLKVKYRTLIDTIKANSPNAYIVISCMLPCRARWQALVPSTADHAQQMWAGLNQSIIDNEYGADAVASIHQWALAYNDFVLRPEYDTGDKIHENKAGQQVILLSWLSAMFNNNSLSKGGQ